MNTTASTVTEKESPFSGECESVLQAVGNGHVTHPVFAWVLVTITLTAITVITFLTNVTVLAALTVGRGRPSSYSLSMTLTLSLLTSDLMLSVGVMPFAVYNIVGESWILGKVACRMYLATDIVLSTASILHLAGLAFDRYLAICRPFLHARVTARWGYGLSAALWLLAFLQAFPAMVPVWHDIGAQEAECVMELYETGRTCVWLTNPLFLSVVIPLSFFAPLLLIVGFHALIYTATRQHLRQLHRLQPRRATFDSEGETRNENDSRLVSFSLQQGSALATSGAFGHVHLENEMNSRTLCLPLESASGHPGAFGDADPKGNAKYLGTSFTLRKRSQPQLDGYFDDIRHANESDSYTQFGQVESLPLPCNDIRVRCIENDDENCESVKDSLCAKQNGAIKGCEGIGYVDDGRQACTACSQTNDHYTTKRSERRTKSDEEETSMSFGERTPSACCQTNGHYTSKRSERSTTSDEEEAVLRDHSPMSFGEKTPSVGNGEMGHKKKTLRYQNMAPSRLKGTPPGEKGTPFSEKRKSPSQKGTPLLKQWTQLLENGTPPSEKGTPPTEKGTPYRSRGTPSSETTLSSTGKGMSPSYDTILALCSQLSGLNSPHSVSGDSPASPHRNSSQSLEYVYGAKEALQEADGVKRQSREEIMDSARKEETGRASKRAEEAIEILQGADDVKLRESRKKREAGKEMTDCVSKEAEEVIETLQIADDVKLRESRDETETGKEETDCFLQRTQNSEERTHQGDWKREPSTLTRVDRTQSYQAELDLHVERRTTNKAGNNRKEAALGIPEGDGNQVRQSQTGPMEQSEGDKRWVRQSQTGPMEQSEGGKRWVRQSQTGPMERSEGDKSQVRQSQTGPMEQSEGDKSQMRQSQTVPVEQSEGDTRRVRQSQRGSTKQSEGDKSQVRQSQTVPVKQSEGDKSQVRQSQTVPLEQLEGDKSQVRQSQTVPVEQSEGDKSQVRQSQTVPVEQSEGDKSQVRQSQTVPVEQSEGDKSQVRQSQTVPVEQSEGGKHRVRQSQRGSTDKSEDDKNQGRQSQRGPTEKSEGDKNRSQHSLWDRVRRQRGKKKASRGTRREDNKAMRTVLCLVLCFVVCWMPVFIVLLVQGHGGYAIPLNIINACTWLGYVNSTLNPVLYYRYNTKIRHAIRFLLGLSVASTDGSEHWR